MLLKLSEKTPKSKKTEKNSSNIVLCVFVGCYTISKRNVSMCGSEYVHMNSSMFLSVSLMVRGYHQILSYSHAYMKLSDV